MEQLSVMRRSGCVDRLSSFASRETESPLSGRWADISEAEADSETDYSFCEESLFSRVPAIVLSGAGSKESQGEDGQRACEAAATPVSAAKQPRVFDIFTPRPVHEANIFTPRPDHEEPLHLNPYAPEFLPTLSMECPLVGVFEVIAEGSELQPHECEDFSEDRFNFVPQQCLVPVQQAKSRSKSFWKKPRPARLETKAPAEVPSSASQPVRLPLTETCLQRRSRNIEAGKETKEYQWQMEQVRLYGPGEYGAGEEPLTPDPTDHSISKRSWQLAVQLWRQDLRRRYERYGSDNRPEDLSVASTEVDEVQGSEAEDSISTTNSDDVSSSSWQFR
jgi:hypothetical protein